MVDQLRPRAFSRPVRGGHRTDQPIDCERAMSDEITARRRTAAAVLLALLAALGLLAGYARTVGGTAVKPGSHGVNRNDDSRHQFPNLLTESDGLGEDLLATTVGADPQALHGTSAG